MQDNSFDKHIEKELHDINIKPSGHVWTAVEKELDRKKRRYPFGWWLLPLLLIGIATLLYIQMEESIDKVSSNNPASNSNLKKQVAVTQITKIPGGNPISVPPAPDEKQTNTLITEGAAAAKPIMATPRVNQVGVMPGTREVKTQNAKAVVNSKGRTKANIVAADLIEDIANTEGHKLKETVSVNTALINESSAITSVAFEEKELAEQKRDSVSKINLPGKIVQEEKKSNNKKWSNEWVAAAGITQMQSLDFSGENAELTYTPGNTGSNPTQGSTTRERNEYNFTNGLYLGIGNEWSKSISKRFAFVTGLHYNYQSIKLEKRVIIDSALSLGTSTSYATISDKLYNEQLNFHNLNIPLMIRYSPWKNIDLTAGLYNIITVSSNWNKYATVLGASRTYMPVLHFSPSINLNKFSVGPLINIGLSQNKSGQNLFNYGIMLRYSPKKYK